MGHPAVTDTKLLAVFHRRLFALRSKYAVQLVLNPRAIARDGLDINDANEFNELNEHGMPLYCTSGSPRQLFIAACEVTQRQATAGHTRAEGAHGV